MILRTSQQVQNQTVIKSNILHYKKPDKREIGETYLNTSTKIKSSTEHGAHILHTYLTRYSKRRKSKDNNGRGIC